jgi:hypothetical protein
MYKITVAYDGEKSPRWTQQFSDALKAFETFAEFKDWGFADEYSTVNLSMPDGKMYTRIFYRRDRLVITK